jgi:muramoyltetrapeptide carboxypeptidase
MSSSSKQISRRHFATLVAAALALPGAAAASSHPQPHRPGHPMKRHLIKPPRLLEGDLVGLIAPSGHTSDSSIEKSVRQIEALGFRCKQAANLRAVRGNYAGSVEQRLLDLHAMFADPEVKAIWCIRGGSGCISLLSKLDYALIRANPKVLLGYSDITALHLAIGRHAGLVTFHGPVASSTPSDYSTAHMLAVLMDPQPTYTIPMAMENALRASAEPHYAIRTVHGGQATGTLTGGNLSMVSALVGTAYAAEFRDSILFFEEINEAPYRIDRWLTQLDLSLGLGKAAAVMIGICEHCGGDDEDLTLTLDETLDIHLQPLKVPAVTGYSFGHIRNQFTIPMGVRARLDTERQTVTLLEAAVV